MYYQTAKIDQGKGKGGGLCNGMREMMTRLGYETGLESNLCCSHVLYQPSYLSCAGIRTGIIVIFLHLVFEDHPRLFSWQELNILSVPWVDNGTNCNA